MELLKPQFELTPFMQKDSTDIESVDSIFIRNGGKYEKVNLTEILYIKANGSYSDIATLNKNFSSSNNLNYISNKLKHSSFARIHRSYIVNLENITGFDSDFVYFDDKYIPYSKSNKEEFMSRIVKVS